MVRVILFGLWLCTITVVSAYAAVYMGVGRQVPTTAQEFVSGLKYETTRAVSVPVIAKGAVQGYVVSQYVYTADTETLSKLKVPPDVFIIEEAFRHFFTDKDLDFKNLKAFDTAVLVAEIRDNVNRRLQGPVIRDLMINDLNFVSRDDLRR
jgi:hypothetical protein